MTGGVVSEQIGRLSLKTHVETIKASYALIAEIFPNSFVIPVLGKSDYYP